MDMTPEQYEKLVASDFEKKGYKVELTASTNDYGVDIFLEKNSKKIAVQAKMFGNTSRKINRRMVMEFYGAKDYFECAEGIIVTDGEILSDAEEVAEKLGIDVQIVPSSGSTLRKNQKLSKFEEVWEKHIIPLKDKTLRRENGETNKIIEVDWGGIVRITSNGKKRSIPIDIFKQAINHIFTNGSITRKEINEEYAGRASSGIVLILSQVPIFRLNKKKPMSIELKR
jgi:restriction system protein